MSDQAQNHSKLWHLAVRLAAQLSAQRRGVRVPATVVSLTLSPVSQ